MAGSNMRGAFVLFEGLLPTVIDSQALTHVRLARERLGIDMTVLAFACSRQLFEYSLARRAHAERVAGGEVRVLRGIRPALPAAAAINRLALARALKDLGRIDFVHARGDHAAAVAGPVALRNHISTLWDCRGDSRAEIRERFKGRSGLAAAAAAFRATLVAGELKIAGRTCAGACFVTRQLRETMSGFLRGQPCWIIPCLALESEFFFDPALRTRMRRQLGIEPSDIVYVYVGSLARYQRFDDMVELVRKRLSVDPRTRLLVLTPDVEEARGRCAALPPPRVLCAAIANTEVNTYLNAADLGMLLRDGSDVNRVAFPTKFAEYALTGLQIVMDEAPPSCADAARELGIHAGLDVPTAPLSEAARTKVAAAAAGKLGRIGAMPIYAAMYQRIAAMECAPATLVRATTPGV